MQKQCIGIHPYASNYMTRENRSSRDKALYVESMRSMLYFLVVAGVNPFASAPHPATTTKIRHRLWQ